VALRKNPGLLDGLGVIGAHERFIPGEMAVIAYCISAILWHYRGVRPEDASH
jgi:hypothetical protein